MIGGNGVLCGEGSCEDMGVNTDETVDASQIRADRGQGGSRKKRGMR